MLLFICSNAKQMGLSPNPGPKFTLRSKKASVRVSVMLNGRMEVLINLFVARGKSDLRWRPGNVLSFPREPFSRQIGLFVVPKVNQSPKPSGAAIFRGR